MAGLCKTKSNSAGQITDDNRQAVETQPSSKHQEDFTLILCELQKMNQRLEKMLMHFEVITSEDI